MSYWCDRDILRAVQAPGRPPRWEGQVAGHGPPLVEPFVPAHLGPASLDLTLQPLLLVPFVAIDGHCHEALSRPDFWEDMPLSPERPGLLEPGVFALAATRETVCIPAHAVGYIEGRSTWARFGLQIHQAGMLDPGFCGTVTLELVNHGPLPIRLMGGERICQLVVADLTGLPARSYTERGHYQGQTGPTLPVRGNTKAIEREL